MGFTTVRSPPSYVCERDDECVIRVPTARRVHATAIRALIREDANLGDGENYPDSPTIGFRAVSSNARGNSWVFDEAERLSIERARGTRVHDVSPNGSLGSQLSMSRKRNGSDRSLRSLLSIGSGSPTVERGAKRRESSRDLGDESRDIVNSPNQRHPERAKTYRAYNERMSLMRSASTHL